MIKSIDCFENNLSKLAEIQVLCLWMMGCQRETKQKKLSESVAIKPL